MPCCADRGATPDRAASLRDDRQRRRAAEIEVSPIPEVSPDDPPAQFAGAFSRLRKLPQPRQIVGGGREGEGPSDAFVGAELGSLLAGDHLDPAEGFLDPLADALAQSVAGMARRAAVDRRRAAVRIQRYVRRRIRRAQFTDEVLGVVSLVGADRNRSRSGWRQDRPRCHGGLPRRRIRNRLERLQLMLGRQRGRGRRTPQSTAWRGGPSAARRLAEAPQFLVLEHPLRRRTRSRPTMKRWYGMTLHEASEQALRLQDACTLVANRPFAPRQKGQNPKNLNCGKRSNEILWRCTKLRAR
jgi:hypothetical protein